jgi:hypothetical protein
MMLVTSPLLAQPVPADQANTDHVIQRRYQITLMENVLTSAVRHAAETMGRRIQAVTPNVVLMTGTARARGFVLPDYGVFFDVEVPALPLSVSWTFRVMERDLDMGRSLQTIRSMLGSLPDAQRKDAEQALRRIELSLGPIAPPSAETGSPVRPAGAVEAAAVVPPGAATASPVPAMDPDVDYTETVKHALIDAMLDFSGPMQIGPEEWLSVAARDSYGPMSPGEIYDAMTIVLRIRGSDLQAFRADRLTREEARKRVEVREF